MLSNNVCKSQDNLLHYQEQIVITESHLRGINLEETELYLAKSSRRSISNYLFTKEKSSVSPRLYRMFIFNQSYLTVAFTKQRCFVVKEKRRPGKL